VTFLSSSATMTVKHLNASSLGEVATLVPSSATRLCVDVGTSRDAPNSAYWLDKWPDVFVIGVEPAPINIDILFQGRPLAGAPQYHLALDQNQIYKGGSPRGEINGRFCLIETAIDNVEAETTSSFYITDERNSGCSSLLKPTALLGLDVIEVYQTPTISLKTVLDKLIPSKFEYVTFLKTDTQGTDLNVVKSCQEYLNNILFVQMEVYTRGQYEKEQKLEDIEQFMFSRGFRTVTGTVYDRVYINKELSKHVEVPRMQFIET
jgi:hypothetical protein